MKVDELPDYYEDISIKGHELAVAGWDKHSLLLFKIVYQVFYYICLHFYTIHGNNSLIIFGKPSIAVMTIFCNLKKKWDQFSCVQVIIIFFSILQSCRRQVFDWARIYNHKGQKMFILYFTSLGLLASLGVPFL